jgi:proprotein convertase subtilisin/kexin type 5
MILIFYLLSTLVSADLRCGHTAEFDSDLQFESRAPGRSMIMSTLRSDNLAPIRIYLHYFNLNLSTDLENEFKNQLMRTVQDFYQRRLLVYPMKSNLKLAGFTRCSTIVIPLEHQTVGVPADLIIYVTGNSYPNESWVARAGACILESRPYNNVLAGRIEINSAFYTANLSFEDKMQTVIHEIFHVLGFSNSLYQYYHKDDGSSYLSSELTLASSIRDKTVTLFKTPTVLSKARAAFGCTTLPGLELEDGGGSGTAGSHWEKRMMFNDFMVGDIGPTDIVYSDITFALLKDSGWYDINWNYTDTLYYGKNRGCNFYDQKCVVNSIAQFPEFCTDDIGTPKCDYLRLNKGTCTKVTQSTPVPTYANYFNNPSIGGMDSYLDYCPTIIAYDNGSCRGTGANPTNLVFGAGEAISMSSRCLEHNLLVNSYSYYPAYQSIRAGCYPVSCGATSFNVTVGSVEVNCSPGQQISVPGFQGKLICPTYKQVCSGVPCPLSCRGVGKCLNGECKCDSGYGGSDCSIQCHPTCKNCDGFSSSSCISCPAGSILSNGSCILSVITCPALCNSCSNTSACTSCISNASLNTSGNCSCNSGFIASNGQCVLQCNDLCTNCGTLGCLSCKLNASVSITNPLLCSCNSGYFYSNGVCALQCNDLCSSCSASGCTSCKPNSLLKSGSVTECACSPEYTYNNGQCVLQCNDLCATCSISGCTQCKLNSYISPSSPTSCSCNSGYTNANGVCIVQCNDLCASCGTTSCNQCVSNASLSTSPGNCECNPGTTKSGSSCIAACNDLCTSCGSSSCISCKSNSSIVPTNTYTCQCNTGYYYLGGLCYPICNSLCAYCTLTGCAACKANAELSGPNNCQCKAGFLAGNGGCVMQCNDLCLNCSSTGCLGCAVNSSVSNTSPSTCVCNTGFVYYGGQCVPACNNLCRACDAGGCMQCTTNSVMLAEDPFKCQCQVGYSNINGECVYECNDLCESCENNACKVCKPNSYATSSLNTCQCAPGFKYEDGSCVSMCNDLCSSCQNSGCANCKTHSSLIPTNLYSCSCDSGYFNVEGTCVSLCNDLCLHCTMQGCSSCALNSSINVNNTSTCDCNPGYSYSNSTCILLCNTNCLSCSSTGCLQCAQNTVLSTTNSYNCITKTGFLSNRPNQPNQPTNNQPVITCDISCGLCSEDGFSCVACKNDAYLQEGKCICRPGFLMNTISGVCEAIHN